MQDKLKYICRNKDCGMVSYANTFQEIVDKGKLCKACYSKAKMLHEAAKKTKIRNVGTIKIKQESLETRVENLLLDLEMVESDILSDLKIVKSGIVDENLAMKLETAHELILKGVRLRKEINATTTLSDHDKKNMVTTLTKSMAGVNKIKTKYRQIQ